MRSRRELIAEVEELGRDLGEEVSTERLNNAALAELADALRARLEARTRPPAQPASLLAASASRPIMARPPEADKQRPPPPIVHDTAPQPQTVDGAAPEGKGGPPPPKAEAQAAPPRAPYYVAPGRSIAARGRILGPLKPVTSADFPGGQSDLDYFVLKGAVVRRS